MRCSSQGCPSLETGFCILQLRCVSFCSAWCEDLGFSSAGCEKFWGWAGKTDSTRKVFEGSPRLLFDLRGCHDLS